MYFQRFEKGEIHDTTSEFDVSKVWHNEGSSVATKLDEGFFIS